MELTTLTQAVDALAVAQSRISSLEADLVAANALLEEQAANFKFRIDELVAAHEATKVEAKVSEMQVTEVLASVGVAPVDIALEPSASKPASREDLWAEYRALPLEQRNAFYITHKSTLKSI